MKKHIVTSLIYTAITTLFLGVAYPLAVTAIAHVFFRDKANGQLIYNKSGNPIGSKLIGQPFTGPEYFHSRPSAAGAGYDASASSGSNLGPTNQSLIDRVKQSASTESVSGVVPIDLVTASGSGLDPDISLAAAYYQVPRVAAIRGIKEDQLRQLVEAHITPRQFGVLGEARINVLELNLLLDSLSPKARK